MSIARLQNQVRLWAERALSHITMPRMGIVTNYDPDRHAARVQLQPEGILTGYLPVTEPWVGNGWGMYAPPNIGDVVEVHFQQGSKEAGFIVNRFYSAKTKPLSVPSGEFWIVHKSGSYVKFHNDGSVTISALTNTLRLEAENIQIHATSKYRFDCNGHGQSWLPDRVNTWQIGEVPGTAHNISPPEIGD